MVAQWLTTLETRLAEGDEEQLAEAVVSIAFVAGAGLAIDDDERRPAARRALLLLAAGGDPLRGLDLGGRAVTALADELETRERVAALERGLAELAAQAGAHPHVKTAVDALRDAPDVAWRAYVAGLLAEEMDEE